MNEVSARLGLVPITRSGIQWRLLRAAAVVACALLSLGNEVRAQDAGLDAQKGAEQQPADPDDSQRGYPDEQQPGDSLSGYPEEGQPPVGIADAEEDLDDTFPKRDSVLGFGVPDTLSCQAVLRFRTL